jgi:hypothetical protein
MLLKKVPQKYLVFSCSNMLITEKLGLKTKSIPQIFIINELNDFKEVLKLYFKVINTYKDRKDRESFSIPTFCNWYWVNDIRSKGYDVIPQSILLLLRRPRPTSPHDLQLLKDDLMFWYKKLIDIIDRKSFEFIFIYDIHRLFHILTKYIPLLLLYKEMNISETTLTCCYNESVCEGYIGEFGDFSVLFNFCVPSICKDSFHVFKDIDISINRVRNPLFDLSNYVHENIKRVQYNINLKTLMQVSTAPGFIIEFTTSFTKFLYEEVDLDLDSDSVLYVWLPLSSSVFIPMISEYAKYLSIRKVIIIDIINNIAEFGSISLDRIWISILKNLVKIGETKVVIGI